MVTRRNRVLQEMMPGLRRAKIISVLVLTCSLILSTTSYVALADNVPNTDLTWPLPVANGDIGFTAINDFSNDWQAFSRIFVSDGSERLCSGFDDTYCQSHLGVGGWQLLQILPPCSLSATQGDCIDGLDVSDGQIWQPSTFIRTLPYPTFAADASRGVPAGGQPSLWTNPFSSDPNSGLDITVSGYMRGSGDSNGSGPYNFQNFAASVKSYQTTNGNFAPIEIVPAAQSVNEGTGDLGYSGPVSGCIWTDSGTCGVQTAFPGIKQISLKLRLPNSLTGWLAGRLSNPAVVVSRYSDSQNLLTVTGSPAEVALVAAHVSLGQATPDMISFANQNQGDAWRTFRIDNIAQLLNIYKPITKDTASKLLPTWSFTDGYGQSTNPCLQNPKDFVGLVTTNAAAYQFDAPTFSHDSLNYSLASPHFQPNGQPFEGTYDLLLSSSAARCLYHFSRAPLTASVSILNDDGTSYVSTSVLKERAGWLHLNVSGLHFSNPTIRVKLAQTSPIHSRTTSSKPLAAKRKSEVITCVKGKVAKKVIANRPVCPSGYKKK